MLGPMKPRLSPALQQHLVLTPQLRQAIRLLQLSTVELEAEVAEAVASNPLLDWAEDGEPTPGEAHEARDAEAPIESITLAPETEDHWDRDAEPWQERIGPSSDRSDIDEMEHPAAAESLRDHLLFQLHLGHFSQRDASIGIALVDAIDDDGYLREDLEELARSLRPEIDAGLDEVLQVLHRIQQFDPVGVGARNLGECLRLQLRALAVDTPGRDVAMLVTAGPLQRLPKIGIDGVCHELHCERGEAEAAVQLLRSLDPRPGSQHGELPAGTYVTPDCVIWRQQGLWRVALASGTTDRKSVV